MGKEKKGLSVRHERFAVLVAAGTPAMVAYEKAGYVGGSNAEKNAHRLTENEGVKARISEIRAAASQKQEKEAVLTVEEKLAFLAKVIRAVPEDIGPDSPLCQEYTEELVAGGTRGKLRRGNAPEGNEKTGQTVIRRKVKTIDKMRAMELHSKLANHFGPEQLVVETGPTTLASIEARAAAVVSALNRRRGK